MEKNEINIFIYIHICFILFILLSYLIFDFVCLTLSSADTHGIVKYTRTYIRGTHTQAHTQKIKIEVERLEKKEGKRRKNQKKKRGDQEKKKEEKKKGRIEKGGKEGGN